MHQYIIYSLENVIDDGGKSPFPCLSQLEPAALNYALQYRDRFMHKAGMPIAVLKEFCEEQKEAYLDDVFKGNAYRVPGHL